jgi:hypothetical protein
MEEHLIGALFWMLNLFSLLIQAVIILFAGQLEHYVFTKA